MDAILFDLDNTLYPEIEFVKSGFKCISTYLASKYGFNEKFIFERLLDIFEKKGRGKIFNDLLLELDIYSEEELNVLIYLYRSHNPDIKLYNDVFPVLNTLKQMELALGIITDGRASVQQNKINALNLGDFFDVIVYTDKLGSENWKPSTVPYKIALNLLDVSSSKSIYVGDDPYKDFLGPKNLGMETVRIDRGFTENYWAKRGFKEVKANYSINSLKELLPLLRRLFDVQ